jgi:hypothetical protein
MSLIKAVTSSAGLAAFKSIRGQLDPRLLAQQGQNRLAFGLSSAAQGFFDTTLDKMGDRRGAFLFLALSALIFLRVL